MAYPTAVNSQVTDSSLNGTENTQSLPGKITQMSRAFTQTLEMENMVFQKQMNGILDMVLHVVERMQGNNGSTAGAEAVKTELHSMAETMKAHVNAAVPAAADSKPVAKPAQAPNPNEQTLETALVASVGESYKNAIAAQQQMYATLEATVSMAIANIFSMEAAKEAKK